jgi:2-amino-4-hydroxy-6-hydroxymethyldihydropteridine diphosphokinase
VNRAFIGVGSNIRPEENVLKALDLLRRTPGIRVVGVSTFYRTRALTSPGTPAEPSRENPDYLNGVLEVRTALGPAALSTVLEEAEATLGRLRGADKFAPRTMDLDLLLVLPLQQASTASSKEQEESYAPHPEVRSRSFVALPLFELDPHLLVPPDATPISEIAESFPGLTGEPEEAITARLRSRLDIR